MRYSVEIFSSIHSLVWKTTRHVINLHYVFVNSEFHFIFSPFDPFKETNRLRCACKHHRKLEEIVWSDAILYIFSQCDILLNAH